MHLIAALVQSYLPDDKREGLERANTGVIIVPEQQQHYIESLESAILAKNHTVSSGLSHICDLYSRSLQILFSAISEDELIESHSVYSSSNIVDFLVENLARIIHRDIGVRTDDTTPISHQVKFPAIYTFSHDIMTHAAYEFMDQFLRRLNDSPPSQPDGYSADELREMMAEQRADYKHVNQDI